MPLHRPLRPPRCQPKSPPPLRVPSVPGGPALPAAFLIGRGRARELGREGGGREEAAARGAAAASEARGAAKWRLWRPPDDEARSARGGRKLGAEVAEVADGCRKRGYILTIGFAAAVKVGFDTDTVELTVTTLSSRLVTLERIQFSRRFFTDGA
eukprot:388007-Prorocentrum_minimum.AAC.1